MYYAKLVPGPTGYQEKSTPEDLYEDHRLRLGWIQVYYEREVRWARPVLPFATLWVPSLEWIKKYGAYFDVIVEPAEGGQSLLWFGFTLNYSNDYPDEVVDFLSEDYPYLRKFFTENWMFTISDKPDQEYAELRTVDGKTSVRLDVSGSKVTIKAATEVIVQVQPGGKVYLGGVDSAELILKGETFRGRFNNHTHVSGSPGSPTSKPSATFTNSPFTDLSEIVKSQ